MPAVDENLKSQHGQYHVTLFRWIYNAALCSTPLLHVFVTRMCMLLVAGYCGADLKSLCTEAALRALRRRYPQIYDSRDKLQISAASVNVAISDFYCAMRRIVPTAQRSMSSPARPLSITVSPLMQRTINSTLKLFERIFPRALALVSGAGEAGLKICCQSSSVMVQILIKFLCLMKMLIKISF